MSMMAPGANGPVTPPALWDVLAYFGMMLVFCGILFAVGMYYKAKERAKRSKGER